jgi:FtsZ-binding cell division protein ZapB
MYSEEDEPQQQEHKRKFLTLRVHHLSLYEIELEYFSSKKEPYSIDINFVMENHHDVPSPSNNIPTAIHSSKLHLGKHLDDNMQIIIKKIKINTLTINERKEFVHLICPSIDVKSFDDLFTQFEFCIDQILALNKDIKEYKEHRRSDRKHDKHTFPVKKEFYKKQLKQLEHQRSEVKKELRAILVKLYS